MNEFKGLRERLQSTDLPCSLFGIPIIETPYMTKTVKFTRTLTWGKRLWSWPWRPWVATVTDWVQVPSDEILAINCDGVSFDVQPHSLFPDHEFPMKLTGKVSFHMHPDTFARLKREVTGE